MQHTRCPYCNATVETKSADNYSTCPACGYGFARVGSCGESYIVIDSRLPDLMLKYNEISEQERDSVVVIDRRINRTPIAGDDRRR